MNNKYIKIGIMIASVVLFFCIMGIVYSFPKNVSGDTFTIKKWQAVKVGDFKIRLEKIVDSRCSVSSVSDVTCIWQGEILYTVKVSNKKTSKKYELSTELTRKINILDGYSLEIVDYNDSKDVTLKLTKNS